MPFGYLSDICFVGQNVFCDKTLLLSPFTLKHIVASIIHSWGWIDDPILKLLAYPFNKNVHDASDNF